MVLLLTFAYSSSISKRLNCLPNCNGKITQTAHTRVAAAAAAAAVMVVVVVVVWVLCNCKSLSHVSNQYYSSLLWIIMSLHKEISDLLALIGSIIFNTAKITHSCVIWVRFVVLLWISICFVFLFTYLKAVTFDRWYVNYFFGMFTFNLLRWETVFIWQAPKICAVYVTLIRFIGCCLPGLTNLNLCVCSSK